MRYMLDTDICIYSINERPPHVLEALRRNAAGWHRARRRHAAELHCRCDAARTHRRALRSTRCVRCPAADSNGDARVDDGAA
jgi:hypothetical protein